MTAQRLISTARAAGMADALLRLFAKSEDWSSLPRNAVLDMLFDLSHEADRDMAAIMPGMALMQAQEQR